MYCSELKEFYENRVNEIMTRFLKNIKECDQDPNKKRLWDPSTKVIEPSTKVIESSTNVIEHDDIRGFK